MKVTVSKLDAAIRQLDHAIQLWFADGDPVVANTLACAAYQVIEDLNQQRGNKDFHLKETVAKIVFPQYVEDVMALLKKPMTFSKHANRDPNAILEFSSETTDLFIVLSNNGMARLGERFGRFQMAFQGWLLLHKPHWFNPELIKQYVPVQLASDLRKVSKAEFLKGVLQAQLPSHIG